jgi:hypothetical protein
MGEVEETGAHYTVGQRAAASFVAYRYILKDFNSPALLAADKKNPLAVAGSGLIHPWEGGGDRCNYSCLLPISEIAVFDS